MPETVPRTTASALHDIFSKNCLLAELPLTGKEVPTVGIEGSPIETPTSSPFPLRFAAALNSLNLYSKSAR